MTKNALSSGLRRLLRHPQALLIGYLANFLTAGLLVLLPLVSLAEPAHRSAIRDAADGIDAWLITEIIESPITYGALQGLENPEPPPWFNNLILLGGFLTLLVPIAAWIPASFLNGGILLTYLEDRFGWRRFLWGCWHWFGAFFLLNITQGFLATVTFGGLLTALLALSAILGNWINWIGFPLIILLALLWLAIFESTRLLAVREGTRNIFQAFGKAIRFVFSKLLTLFLLYIFSLLSLSLVHAIFRLGLMPILPLSWWPIVLIFTQLFIILRLGIRLARWAGLVALISHQHNKTSFSVSENYQVMETT